MIGTPNNTSSQESLPQPETLPRVEAQPQAHTYQISPQKAPMLSPLEEDVPTLLKPEEAYENKKSKGKRTSPRSVTALITSSIALVLFVVLFFNMAPGYNIGKIVCYAVSGSVALCLYVFSLIRIIRCNGRRLSTAVIIISAVLTALIISFNAVYLVKADSVTDSIAQQDTIDVSLDIDESFFSRAYGGNVLSPYAYIEISGVRINNNDVFTAMTDVKYDVTVVCGHSQCEGKAETTITIPSESIADGYKTSITVDIGATQYAEVTLTIKRSVSFWQVVFG